MISDTSDAEVSEHEIREVQIANLRQFEITIPGEAPDLSVAREVVFAHRYQVNAAGVLMFLTVDGDSSYMRHSYREWYRVREIVVPKPVIGSSN